MSLVDTAARSLTPVVVETSAADPRLFAYMDSVVCDPSPRLILRPIAADALPRELSSWIQVHPLGQAEPWSLWVPEIRALGPDQAEIPLALARVHRAAHEMTGLVELPSHSLVLVVNSGVEDIDTPVFPVSHIGAEECTIESSSPLAIDLVLPSVEIAGERRILRRASARVLETTAWLMADGTRRFRCRLSLGSSQASETDEMYDLVKSSAHVRRLLDLAGMTNAPGWFEAPGWGRGGMQVREVTRDTAVLALNDPYDAKRPPRIVRIGVEIFSAHYEMEVRALSCSRDEMQVALPLILRRRRRHRRAHRVAPGDQQRVRLTFRNPATGKHFDRAVLDVSFFGVAFAARSSDPLWPELPLEDAQLSFQDLSIELGDLDVRAVDRDESSLVCRAAITKPRIADDPRLIDLIARIGHPDIAVHAGDDFQALIDIYVRAGLFAPFMHRNLDATIEEARAVWHALHTQAPDVMRTLVHGGAATPDGAVTAIRAWEHAWMAQHFVSVRPQIDGSAGPLQMAYVDHVLPRPDAHYLLFFVKADNHRMNAFYERFFASTGTPEAVTRTTAELWTHRGEPVLPEPSAEVARLRVRDVEQKDDALVARAVRRVLGAMQAAALSMQEGELLLPDTSARFGRAGLVRTRSCRLVIDADGLPLYVIIEEVSSPGVNLTWLLNTNWILPIHATKERHDALTAAVRNVLSRPAQSPTGDRFITVLTDTAPSVLTEHGFNLEAPVHVYVMNRAGLHRYYFYTASRYGELDARTMRRRSKRPPQG